MEDRQRRLLGLIEQATGNTAYTGNAPEEDMEAEADAHIAEAELTIRVA